MTAQAPGTGLPAGVGTGVGSMPGTDPSEAVRIASGELDLAFLPELPARGVGADMIGRTGALLVDLPLDMVHHAYRLTDHPNTTTRRARDWLRWDLDALEEHWEASGLVGSGRTVKVQACGPLTFAANAELRGGHKIVKDRGAVRDIAASLTEGLRGHVAEVTRRLGAKVLVQLDEPDVGRVIDGTVTPLTRLDPIRPIPAPDAAELMQGVVDGLDVPVLLHSCGRPRWDLTDRLERVALSIDLTRLRPDADYDRLGAFVDSDGVLAAGLVPATEPETPVDAETLAGRLTELIDRIGLPRRVLCDNILVTPVCGLAGATGSWATRALSLSSEIAAGLAADPDYRSS